MRSIDNPSKTARASASCAPLQTLIQTCSDSISASTTARQAGRTRSNESGKLIPSRRGQESQVAACGSHSAGMRYPSAAGVCVIESIGTANVQQPALSATRIGSNVQHGAWNVADEPGTPRRNTLRLTPASDPTSCLQRNATQPLRERACRSRLVNRTDDRADDGHFNQRANAPVHHEIARKGLHSVGDQVRPDSQKGNHNAEFYAATNSTTGKDQSKHEGKDQLAGHQPSKVTFEVRVRPLEPLRECGISVFQKHCMKEPAKDEDEDPGSDEG